MNIRYPFILLVFFFVFATTVACDAGKSVLFMGNASPTTTLTPRPTSIPSSTMTATPLNTPTSEPTATLTKPTVTAIPSKTATSIPIIVLLKTPTPKPTLVPPKTATPKPVVPTLPPPIFIEWKQSTSSNQGRCDAGPGTFEVKGRIYGGNAYVGGIHVVVIGNNGNVIAQADSRYPIELNPEWGVSCFEEKNMFNYQIDISAGRDNSPLTLRLTRSKSDLTPISTDIRFNVTPGGGRWYFDFVK